MPAYLPFLLLLSQTEGTRPKGMGRLARSARLLLQAAVSPAETAGCNGANMQKVAWFESRVFKVTSPPCQCANGIGMARRVRPGVLRSVEPCPKSHRANRTKVECDSTDTLNGWRAGRVGLVPINKSPGKAIRRIAFDRVASGSREVRSEPMPLVGLEPTTR